MKGYYKKRSMQEKPYVRENTKSDYEAFHHALVIDFSKDINNKDFTKEKLRDLMTEKHYHITKKSYFNDLIYLKKDKKGRMYAVATENRQVQYKTRNDDGNYDTTVITHKAGKRTRYKNVPDRVKVNDDVTNKQVNEAWNYLNERKKSDKNKRLY